jgi:hypothetical protein
MKQKKKSPKLLPFSFTFFFLALLVIVFVLIRTIHFPERLDFSTDQATASSAVLEMVRNHHPVLIGPRFTLEYNGRYMFFGPLPYYFQTPFMILGNFDPIKSSYLFMMFRSLMVIPIYFGTKKLINKNAAITFSILFTLLPFFVDYTSFLWNPNFQLVLSPILVYLMGVFKEKKSLINFFWLSLVMGCLLEYHFIFIFIIFILGAFYFLIQKLNWRYFFIFILGLILGMGPLILFDLRNNFYETRTLLIFIQHFKEVLPGPGKVSGQDPHYLLPFVFFGALLLIYLIRKYLSPKVNLLIFLSLLALCLFIYLPIPAHGYGMPNNWNYLDELKVHQIIMSQNVINFNIANLIYDPQAAVQKYLLEKDNVEFNNNYLSNDYLFVLSTPKDYLNDPAFELKKLQPAEQVQSWTINNYYNLYLAHRLPKN